MIDSLNDAIWDQDYLDRQGGGCGLHPENPACLCDVDRSKFICGDGPYNVSAGTVEAFLDRSDEDDPSAWFDQAFTMMWWDTFRRGVATSVEQVCLVIERHPDIVQALLDGSLSTTKARGLNRVQNDAITDVARLLGVAPRNSGSRGQQFPLGLRNKVLSMYDNEGLPATAIHEHLHTECGLSIPRSTIYGWIRRFAKTYDGKRPSDYPSKKKVAA